jgi:4-amino-4-deoxy-L-arabinose transferase-like glycosyltransferase
MPLRIRHYLFLALLGTFAFLVNNQQFEVTVSEARNFRSAQEILISGEWLIPTLNEEPRVAKPPLPTWCCAAVAKVAGNEEHLGLLRLPGAVLTILFLLFFYEFFGAVTENRSYGLLGASVLGTTGLTLVQGRICTWDIFCVVLMMGAVWQVWRGLHSDNASAPFALGGLFAGLSFMSKGPVAFGYMLLPFLLSYWFVFGVRGFRSKSGSILLGVGVCTVVSAWWPAYVYVQHAQALSDTVATETSAWTTKYVRSVFYYKYFPLTIGVWLLPFLTAFVSPLFPGFSSERQRQTWMLSMLWLALSFTFVSLVPEKKYRYLLPLVVPAAMLVTSRLQILLERLKEEPPPKWSLWEFRLYGLSLAISILLCGLVALVGSDERTYLTWIGLSLASGCSLYTLHATFQRRTSVFLSGSLLFSVALSTVAVVSLRDAVLPKPTLPNLRAIREVESIRTLPLYRYGAHHHRVIFLAGRTVYSWRPADSQPTPPPRPFALLSREQPQTLLSEPELSAISIERLGSFQFDRLPDPRVYHLSILRDREGLE